MRLTWLLTATQMSSTSRTECQMQNEVGFFPEPRILYPLSAVRARKLTSWAVSLAIQSSEQQSLRFQ
jgi:hypothetical protein